MPTTTGEWKASSGVRRFEFDYTAPNLASPQNRRFRHKLAGMDHDWVDAGTRRVAYYSQLPPGEYQFHVMVGGSDNQWHAAARVVPLHVVPRFWEQRWLRVLSSGLVVGIVGGSFAWRQRRKYRLRLERSEMRNALENERRRIAHDLHDEFGSCLTGIALQGEAATQTGNIPSPEHSEIVSMTQGIRQLIAALDEVVWATDPRNDTLANVVAFLCDYAEDFLSRTTIKSRLDVPSSPELPAQSLTAETRHNLLLAAKEALNNCVRHAEPHMVRLKIHIEAGWLLLELSDNGRGFDPSKVRAGGNGLSNIKSRLESIHGRSEIRSQTGQGTTVTLAVPLPPAGEQI